MVDEQLRGETGEAYEQLPDDYIVPYSTFFNY
jgi:hypothetical protein